MSEGDHRGVAQDDPRNRGAIDFFRPRPVTEAYVRQRLAAVSPRAAAAEIEAKARQFMADMAHKTVAPPPPLSQPVASARDPVFGLGVHPEIIEQLWALDRTLPRSCRWLVWGHPALVHPQTGVIFAVAIGTIGIVLRLPPALADRANSVRRLGPVGGDYDIAPAGPGWRFWRSDADADLAPSAFAHAAEPA